MVAPRRRVLRVLVTGAESTGKSRLCADLARFYRTTWCPEYLREFFDAHQGHIEPADQVEIAQVQVARERLAAQRSKGLLFVDTDPIRTIVYSELYFGWVDPRVTRLADREKYDLILLLHPDVPWQPDPQRDLPKAREKVHQHLRKEMRARGMAWVDIKGDWDTRWKHSVQAIDDMLKARSRKGTSAAVRTPKKRL